MAVPDIETMTPAELLSMPDTAMPAGALTELWSRRAGIIEQRNADELARELDPNYTGPRLMTAKPVSEKERIEEEQREALRLYIATMRNVSDGTADLLDRIDQQQEINRRRLQEIEKNAIHLHDGRAVYIDGSGYRDGQGQLLTGDDATEAGQLRSQNPNASTWDQKAQNQKQFEEDERLRQKVQRLHDDAQGGDGESLSSEERDAKAKDLRGELSKDENEFNQRFESADGALPSGENFSDDTFGGADYMAYGRSMSSHASSMDGAQSKVLTASFTPAAAGQGADTTPGNDSPRVTPVSVTPVQNPSR